MTHLFRQKESKEANEYNVGHVDTHNPLGFVKLWLDFPLCFIILKAVYVLLLSKNNNFFLSILSKTDVFPCVFQGKYVLLHQYNNKNKKKCI